MAPIALTERQSALNLLIVLILKLEFESLYLRQLLLGPSSLVDLPFNMIFPTFIGRRILDNTIDQCMYNIYN